MSELLTEDEALQAVAEDLLAAVNQSDGHWEFPWHACSARPTNAFSGRAFKGQNLVCLWAAAKRRKFEVHYWANAKAWERRGHPVRRDELARGTVIMVPVFDEEDQGKAWTKETRGIAKVIGPLGGDAGGGRMKKLLGFKREPWYNHAQVDNPPSAIIPPPLPPGEAAFRVEAMLAAWRKNGGPALVHGGMQACWMSDKDRIQMPKRDTFVSRRGISGHEWYVGTLLHEHIHASGSKGRLKRKYGPKGSAVYAAEELLADCGACFLAARLGLPVGMREDHAHYVKNWLQVIGERNQQKKLLWAIREAERAGDFILEMAGWPKSMINDGQVAA